MLKHLKSPIHKIFIAVVLASIAVGAMYALSARHRYTGAFQFVCRQVFLKHYFGQDRLADWYRNCLADRDRVTPSMKPEKIADVLRQRMAVLESSHLEIYSPADDKLVWSGKSAGDNGIRTRGIDGRIIVTEVIPKSSAEKVGVRPGDIILTVYGEKAYGAYPYNEIDGEITVRRGSTELPFKVKAGELQIDFSPQLTELADDVGLLRISSFRKEYFKAGAWAQMADALQDYPSVILDLRGNLGGDFNAVMKVLSFFMCEKNDFGSLERPASPNEGHLVFLEDSTEEEFYSQLTKSSKLSLHRFPGPCFNGAITVLVDNDTASVSEIAAAILSERRQTRVWGEVTRGDMLLGVWYPFSALGAGYTLSVPEAIYYTPERKVIEGEGVKPSRTLYYRYDDAIHGVDSWVKAAMAPY